MKKLILTLALSTFLVGCYSSTFQYSNKSPGRTEQVGRTFLIFGLVNSNEVLRAQDLCPEGVQGVETIHTFGNMFLSCLTFNIYTPNTVRVTCQSGAAHNFYLNDEEEVVAQQSFDSEGNMIAETVSSDVL